MTMGKDERQWTDGFKESIYISIFLAFIAFCVVIMFSENAWFGIFVAFIALSLTFTLFLKNHRESTYKFFLTDIETAKQVVTNVLETKSIPYEKDDNSFYINDIKIVVGFGLASTYGPKGTVIKISPDKATHYLLIKSLQEKIDAAFVPKGAVSEKL